MNGGRLRRAQAGQIDHLACDSREGVVQAAVARQVIDLASLPPS